MLPERDPGQIGTVERILFLKRLPAFEGLRNEDYKYVRYFDHGNREFLHDLKNDPDELINLADDPGHQGLLAEMRERTTSTVAQYGGPLDPMKQPFTASTVPHPEASAAVTVRRTDCAPAR